MYPQGFYYFCIGINLVLRFFWAYTLLVPEDILEEGTLFLLAIAETYRRGQWALLRVENENVNNFETYRNILEIPKMKEAARGQK